MKRILAFICMLTLASCSLGRKTIKQEDRRDSASVRTEFVWQVKQIHDSIYLRDSVFVEHKGDTIYLNKWRTQYRERLIHDTLIVTKADTLRIKEVASKEVVKSPSFFQMWRAYIIGAVVMLLIAGCAFVAHKLKLL